MSDALESVTGFQVPVLGADFWYTCVIGIISGYLVCAYVALYKACPLV